MQDPLSCVPNPPCAVVGLQFGDEGKGQITDLLAQEHDILVRYNGGANAGHSVRIGDVKYALHQIPTGILTRGRLNVLANGVALDPEALAREIADLRDLGVTIAGNLRISDRAHLVMPYHKVEERLRETLAAGSLGPDQVLGTTGRGIGPCYADKASRDSALRVADLFDEGHLIHRLRHVVRLKNALLSGLASAAGAEWEPFDVDEIFNSCQSHAGSLQPFIADTSAVLRAALEDGKRILFEGAHAGLLDLDHGTYPYVTSSNSSALGIAAGAGVPPGLIRDVVGVAKLYMSRVGTGPFPTEFFGKEADTLRERAGEYGTSTGRPRRLGWLDIPALRSMARINGISRLCLTGLSMLAGFEEIRVCVGYRYRGNVLDTLPAAIPVCNQLEPVYETLQGFDDIIDTCRSFDTLPQAAREYIRFVESRVAPVGWVCVGRRRDQVLSL